MAYTYGNPHLAVTTDIVIFTIRDEGLKLLLIKRGLEPFKGGWALPGGFVNPDEALDVCARRELQEETGIADVFLEQLYTFGHPNRDPRERVITVAYYALIPSDRLALRAASDAEGVGWFDAEALPALAFDHNEVVSVALQRLRAKLDYSTIAFQFLPTTFTLSDLRRVYEIILGEAIDKRNFRKWVLALDQIEETGDLRQGAHRPAKLYRMRDPGSVEIIK